MMPLTDKSIRFALGIKDPNITFTEDCTFKTIKGQVYLIYNGLLSYRPPHCFNCGQPNRLVKYGYHTTRVIVPSQSYYPTYLMLKRQRFRCNACRTFFDAQTSYVKENCQISQPVRQMILWETSLNNALTDIALRFHVSDRTVQRIIDDEAQRHHENLTVSLPKHMAFDEFKATNTMSFIWCDSDTHRIGAILPHRTSRFLHQYFERFSLETRKRVETITLDLNAGYINLVPKLFPNAKVVVDRFHIVQMMNRVVNQLRIQTMNTLAKKSAQYKFMKREWKQFLRPWSKLEHTTKRYHHSVGYYETDVNLVTECLAIDSNFQAAYDVYQGLLEALQNHDQLAFTKQLHQYRPLHNKLDTTIKTFRKYRKQVLNAVTSPYSNGYLEGVIGRIKKIKNTAYGYRNWWHFIDRIRLQLVWLRTA